ncbi:MAG: hypothetical protein ACOYIK_07050 [Coriobacteriales bacterium]
MSKKTNRKSTSADNQRVEEFSEGLNNSFDTRVRSRYEGKSALSIGIRAGILLGICIVAAVVLQYLDIDQMFFWMVLIVVVGIIIMVMASRAIPRNKKDEEDERNTCFPIIEDYKRHKSINKLMEQYEEWKKGDHSTYTRMHFAEVIINYLQDAKKYEQALSVLYEVGELPLKNREHYDYDIYREKEEKALLEAIEKRKKVQETDYEKKPGKKKKK